MSWIHTISGKRIDYKSVDPLQIDIEDIAISLGNQCRFNGHLHNFYSVAEHSVHVSCLVDRRLRLASLLHDASEAYLSDIPSPLKKILPQYVEMEGVFESAIAKRFNLEWLTEDDKNKIKTADMEMLCVEACSFYGEENVSDWDSLKEVKRPEVGILNLRPNNAAEVFLLTYYQCLEREE